MPDRGGPGSDRRLALHPAAFNTALSVTTLILIMLSTQSLQVDNF